MRSDIDQVQRRHCHKDRASWASRLVRPLRKSAKSGLATAKANSRSAAEARRNGFVMILWLREVRKMERAAVVLGRDDRRQQRRAQGRRAGRECGAKYLQARRSARHQLALRRFPPNGCNSILWSTRCLDSSSQQPTPEYSAVVGHKSVRNRVRASEDCPWIVNDPFKQMVAEPMVAQRFIG